MRIGIGEYNLGRCGCTSRTWTFITARVMIAEAQGDPHVIVFAAIPSPMLLALSAKEISRVVADIATIEG
jgi:hypothetical protein